MPTDLAFPYDAVVQSYNCALYTTNALPGTLYQASPTVSNYAWAQDAVDIGGYELRLGTDGATDFVEGGLRLGLAAIPALSSGQAIARVKSISPYPLHSGICRATMTLELAGSGSGNLHVFNPGPLDAVPTGLGVPGLPGADWRTYISSSDLTVLFWAGPYTRVAQAGLPLVCSSEAKLVYQVHNRPTLTVSAPSGTLTTVGRPTLTWAFSGDGLGQGGFRVRVFTAAQYGIGGFDPEMSPAFIDDIPVGIDGGGSSNQYFVLNGLVKGTTYRAYVMAYQLLPNSLYKHWTTDGTTLAALGATQYAAFVYNPDNPPTPTLLLPPTGATVINDRADLSLTLGAHTVSGFSTKAEWQLATDAGFTANLRTVTEADADLRLSGATTESLTAANELFQGTWWLRGRAVDPAGSTSAWVTNTAIVVSHPPSTTGHSPTGQQAIEYSATGPGQTTFAWVFSDTSTGDAQTAFQLVLERDSDGLVIYDTGKVVSSAASATYAVAVGYKDVLLRWRVRAWDSDDVAGAYSGNQQFYLMDEAVLAAVYPLPLGEAGTPSPTVTWTVTVSGGRVQESYNLTVRRVDTNAVVFASGWVNSALSSAALPYVLVLGEDYQATLQVVDDRGLSSAPLIWTFTAAWDPPDNPVLTVDAALYDSDGYVELTWPENRDASFSSYQLYRKLTSEADWVAVGYTTDSSLATYEYRDYLAPANQSVDYAVTQVAYRFGVEIESAPVAVTLTPAGTHYWLVPFESPESALRLSLVNQDDFSDEWEQGEILLLGRGRRVERGTRYGFRGSISATVHGTATVTPRQVRLALEALKSAYVEVYLRNPFGDVWRVVLSDLAFARVAGVGTVEHFSVSFDYTEVA